MERKSLTTVVIHMRLATASHRKRLTGIFKALKPSLGWNLRIISDEKELSELLTSSSSADVPDGIISCVPYSVQAQNAIARSSIPFVGIGTFDGKIVARDKSIGFVHNDNYVTGVAAAEYFLALGGFRSFAFVSDTHGREWSQLRGEAFISRLSKARKSCLIYHSPPDEANNETRLGEFLAALKKPAAVFASWDARGADVISAARLAGVPTPGGIAVLGVDNDEIFCEHTQPQLSSIITDAEGMGVTAANELIALISHCGNNCRREVVCPILGIAERESTRSPSPAASLIDRALTFIDDEAKHGITPDDVSRHLKVSRRLLDLRFQQYEGFTVHDKIVESRLAEAKRLLSDTNASIRSVFDLSGFGNSAHAYRFFKNKTSLTPESWRRLHQASHVPKTADLPQKPRTGFMRLMSLDDRDADDLLSLAGEIDEKAVFLKEAVASAIESGTIQLYVIRKRNKIVASATAASFVTPTGLHCRIEDVVVSLKWRGKRLGREIMEKVLHDLRQNGFTSVELTSRPSRIAANALYRSLGFKQRKTNVYEFRFVN
ncbi:MAG TPA: GNAT family N-acetyltransferase [Opitutales bacterium]|nr:GNAT family N-acetyltransferase [Opitutales bacterium]